MMLFSSFPQVSLPALLLAGLSALLSETARSETLFPPELTYSENNQSYRLALTGDSERKVLFFKVYGIAHYALADDGTSLMPDAVVNDGPTKALMITFARKLGMARIRGEFQKSLRRNARPEWLVEAAPTIDAFTRAIDRDADAGDELVFYWLDGGRVIVEFNGERAFSVTDASFAKLIWSIWFGADPVCDRDALVARASLQQGQIQ